MMQIGRDWLFLQDPIFGHVFFWHDIYLELGRYALFECKRSDSVLYNVILITRGTIYFFNPQNTQLLTRCHLIGISKVACWGEGMCLNCLLILTSFN